MKTINFILSYAALCMLITFAESATHSPADKIIAGPVDLISSEPVSRLSIVPDKTVSQNSIEAVAKRTQTGLSKDFSYLKFNVDTYLGACINSPEDIELPDDVFSYLKFDVSTYTDSVETNSFETIELPSDTFSYLKFDVNKFINGTELESEATMELPFPESKHK